MKKVLLTAALFTVLSLTAALSAAIAVPVTESANTARATATASANILRGLTISKTEDLNFGQIVPNNGGVVTVSTDGARTSTDAAMLIPGSYDAPQAAAFDVTGDGGHGFSIALPDSAIISNGKQEMTVDNFQSSLGLSSKLEGGLNEAGKQQFTVGADLHVDAAQAYGAYAGTFDVTVTYQ
jgi:hypothetical protein